MLYIETKCYQTEKLKRLYYGLPVLKHWTPYYAVSYVIGYFSLENPINYRKMDYYSSREKKPYTAMD